MIIKKGLPPPPIHPVRFFKIFDFFKLLTTEGLQQSQAARANDLPPPYIASPNNGIPSSSASEFVATPFHTPSRDRDVQGQPSLPSSKPTSKATHTVTMHCDITDGVHIIPSSEFNIHCVNQIHINNRHEDVIGV